MILAEVETDAVFSFADSILLVSDEVINKLIQQSLFFVD
jgi:hypothetical protein